MKFKYCGSKVPFQTRWATEQQLNLRWNEWVVPAFEEAEAFFKLSTRDFETSKSIEISSSMMVEAVARSVDLSFDQMTSQLTKYRDAVITFINNAFRHANSYEDPDNFFSYIEKSKNVAIKDLETLSRGRLVSELRRHYTGLDAIFSDHAAYINDRVNALQIQYETNKERGTSNNMKM